MTTGDLFEGIGTKECSFNPSIQLYNQDLGDDPVHSQLPPVDQENENIVKASVSVQEATSKFLPQIMQKMPDEISKSNRIWLTSKDENIIDRFNRLSWEIQELEKQILQNENDEKLIDLDGINIVDKVKELTTKISKLNKRAFESPLEKIGTPCENLSLLKNDLERAKSRSRIENQLKSHSESRSSNVKYELALNNQLLSKSSFSDEKTYQLEQRITNLERIIGLHALDPATSIIGQETSSLFTTGGTLIGALERLDHHLSILADPLVFDQTMRRVKEATAALDKLAELKRKHKLDQRIGAMNKDDALGEVTSGIGAATPLDSKISYLYNQMNKLDAVGSIIPHLITRLISLKSLHAEAALFSETLSCLKEDQQALLQLGIDTKKGIDVLAKTMLENEEKTLANIESLKK